MKLKCCWEFTMSTRTSITNMCTSTTKCFIWQGRIQDFPWGVWTCFGGGENECENERTGSCRGRAPENFICRSANAWSLISLSPDWRMHAGSSFPFPVNCKAKILAQLNNTYPFLIGIITRWESELEVRFAFTLQNMQNTSGFRYMCFE